jgi:hypothetical protein
VRLTLRTLIAWLDGLLPEADRAELDAKVAASPVAPRLLERIAEVTRRPELPAPRTDGRGLAEDANTAAEFLDNSLPGDRLEAFERVCLDSDIHLAEVADCHAILAALARDPAAVPMVSASDRTRLVEAVSQQLHHPREESTHEEALALARAIQQATGNPAMTGPSGPAPGSRERRAPFGAWLSAIAAVLLLVLLGGLLVRMLWQPAGKERQVAAVERPASGAAPARGDAVAAGGDAAQEPTEPVAAADPTPAAAEPAAPPEPEMPAEPELPAEPSEPAAPPVEPLLATVVPAPVVPIPVMEGDEPEQALVDPAPGEPASPAAAVEPRAIGVVAVGPVLQRLDRDGATAWEPLAATAPLAEVEELIAPVHLYPLLERGGLSIRLSPGTQAALVGDRDGTPRLEVLFGRAVVLSDAADAQVGITAGGLSGRFLLGPKQPLGVEVQLLRERGDDPAVVPPGRRSRLVTTGGGRWRQTEADGGPPGLPLAGLAEDQPLPPRGGLEWDSSAAGAARLLPPGPEPAWMRATAATDPVGRLAAAALTSGLEPRRSAAESLRAMLASRRAEDRTAAAATLALLGDYEPVVSLLADASAANRLREGQWQELEAATVPTALARGANAAAALRQAFVAHGPAGRGEELFLLARGFSDAELAAGGDAALLATLEDPELVFRRYAIRNLVGLLPDPAAATRDYRAERSSPRLNDKGVAWWRAWLAARAVDGQADAAAAGGGEP